jgi:hypothetical protein
LNEVLTANALIQGVLCESHANRVILIAYLPQYMTLWLLF